MHLHLKECHRLLQYVKQSRIYLFLDASKAFDHVCHWNLFYKMKERGVPALIIRILLFWYRSQTICVKWGTCVSESFKVTNGVRQGSILSPRLFALYVDDLSIKLNECNVGCAVDSTSLNHLFYADDLCLMAPTAFALQKLVNICQAYGKSNDILYNPTKSQCMVFKPPRYNLLCPIVTLGDKIIEYRESVKYLGVLICSDSKDNKELRKQTQMLYSRANSIMRRFSECSANVKRLLVDTYCMNFYCMPLWSRHNSREFNKIKAAYNNVYRILLGYPKRSSASHMLVSNNVITFEGLLRKNVYNFMLRLKGSPNRLLQILQSNFTVLNGAMFTRWSDILFSRVV